MGRELKRVPLDWQWPDGENWTGYMNPYPYQECPHCAGSGYNIATRLISNNWYTHSRWDGKEGWDSHLVQEEVQALLDKGRLSDFRRDDADYVPTAEEVNKWARHGMGHDAINRMICVEVRARRLNVYGSCGVCGGDGESYLTEEYRYLSETWEPFEPPVGEGYQLWTTTTEGAPISPVFCTLDGLCAWAEDNATTFGDFKAAKEEWKSMLEQDNVHHKEGNLIFI